MLFDSCLPFSKGCFKYELIASQQAKDEKKNPRIEILEENLHKTQLVDELVFVSFWMFGINDNDRSSYRKFFIGFEFQIQSNRSWWNESQIICAFKIEFPFSRIFGALDKTLTNKQQKLLSSSSLSSLSTSTSERIYLACKPKTSHTHTNWIMISQMPFIFTLFKNPAQLNQIKRVKLERSME